MTDQPPPTEEQIRVAMLQALEQIFLHSKANTEFAASMNAKLAGVEAHTHATVKALDDTADQAALARQVAARKEIIDHLYEKSHQYVAVVMAGFFTANFATLATLAARFSDKELRLSAALLTISLCIFVAWEIINVTYAGIHVLKGDVGEIQKTPRWLNIGWSISMLLSLVTGIPAIGIALYAYLGGLNFY